MPGDGWPGPGSPYHPGEREIQSRVGARELAERQGRRMIRDHLPEQHRLFYEAQPMVFLGGRDDEGHTRATVRWGSPGFVRSLDARTLRIDGSPEGDPIPWRKGSPVGILGLEFETRRRNRANGTVAAVDSDGLTVDVDQSFGNCPKYVWSRRPIPVVREPAAPVIEGSRLSADAVARIRRADTLFLASASPGAGGPDPVEGADVSHRGGRPGFVRVDTDESGDTVLVLPDFAGNSAFNTFGNLARNPSAGLLFVDLDDGGLLELTGRAEIVWDGPELQGFAGALRLLRFRTTGGRLRAAALPFRWTPGEPSPQIARMG